MSTLVDDVNADVARCGVVTFVPAPSGFADHRALQGDGYSDQMQPFTHVGGDDVPVQAAAGGTAAFELPPELEASIFLHDDRFDAAGMDMADEDVFGFGGDLGLSAYRSC